MGYRAGSNPYVSLAAELLLLLPPGDHAAAAACCHQMTLQLLHSHIALYSALPFLCKPGALLLPTPPHLPGCSTNLQVGPGGTMLAALGGVSSAYHLKKML